MLNQMQMPTQPSTQTVFQCDVRCWHFGRSRGILFEKVYSFDIWTSRLLIFLFFCAATTEGGWGTRTWARNSWTRARARRNEVNSNENQGVFCHCTWRCAVIGHLRPPLSVGRTLVRGTPLIIVANRYLAIRLGLINQANRRKQWTNWPQLPILVERK